MKKFLQAAFGCVAICFIILFLSGCLKDTYRNTYKIFTPVYKTLSQVRADMRSSTSQAMQMPGKIYFFGNYIFVNEQNKGIHVIDNTNPYSPKNISFINIPGNVDIAVKGNYLFADSYSDIAVLDISNPVSIKPVSFLNNVIKDKNQYWYSNQTNPDSIRVLVDYIAKDTTVDATTYNRWMSCPYCMYAQASGGVFYASMPKTNGVAGSMARFSIVADYLYAVSTSELYSINIAAPAAPKQTATLGLGWNIETIYPFENKLFVGSNQGMFIFDLSNPAKPTQQSQFMHVTSCDPVIVDGNNAFITLRSGNSCRGIVNELDIVDISNLSAPSLKKTYSLNNPYGLSKDGNKLFVCDGKNGLKIYDATNLYDLKLVNDFTGMETYDVIAFNGKAVMVAKDGLYQYDYSGASVKLLSKMSTSN